MGAPTYFALTFAISWGGVVAVVGFDGFPGTAEDFRILLPMVVIAMVAGPSVAGVAATALFVGKTGLHDLWRRFLEFRVGARWYAVALLTAPLVVSGVLLALSLVSSVFRPGIVTASDPATHLALGLATGIVAGLFEELGWTGFAVPRLRLRYGVVATGLIVGLVWGAWHLLVVWWGSAETAGSLSRTGSGARLHKGSAREVTSRVTRRQGRGRDTEPALKTFVELRSSKLPPYDSEEDPLKVDGAAPDVRQLSWRAP